MRDDRLKGEPSANNAGGAGSPIDLLPPLALILITIGAFSIYQWVQWQFHWQSRLMHPLLFLTWTISWHATVRGNLLSRLGWRLSLLSTLVIPPCAAVAGEALQFVWIGIGHVPELSGALFSLLGVAVGWSILALWNFLSPEPAAQRRI